MIDDHIEIIDGIHEHHYSMDTRIITADYETVFAYAYTKYGKRLKFYNTETGGFVDPQRPESVTNSGSGFSKGQKALNAFTYHYRDMLYMIDKSPDKAAGRAVHEPQNTNKGVEMAFKTLKPLRGTLLHDFTNDENVWSVSALNNDQLVVALFNNDTLPKSLSLNINAPTGRVFTGAVKHEVDTGADGNAKLNATAISASGNYKSWSETISGYSGKVYTFDLSGSGSLDTVRAKEYFSADILKTSTAGKLEFQIPIDSPELNQFTSAQLKFAAMESKSKPQLKLNGKNIDYQYMGGDSRKDLGGVSYASVDFNDVSSSNTLSFESANDSLSVWFSSIVLFSDNIAPVGIEEKVHSFELEVYPNPANNFLKLKSNIKDMLQSQIINVQGQVVLEESVLMPSGIIDVAPLVSGVYILNLTGDEVSAQRMIHFK